MRFGLTEKGFRRKQYADVFEDLSNRARASFGDNVNLTERSFIGLFLRLIAWGFSTTWQLAEKVYFSGYKDTAEGTSLDHVGKYIGILRRGAERAKVDVTFTGTNETLIPSGTQLLAGDIEFVTLEDVIIDGGTATVEASAVIGGSEGNVVSGAINKLVNPRTGVLTVTNPEQAEGGRNIETDPEFKVRYDRSIATGGSSTVASITAQILATEGVIDARVVENVMLTEVDGIPGKSIAPFIYGGTDEDVANAVYLTKPGGIRSFGDVEIEIIDDFDKTHTIGFTRPAAIDIWVNVTLTTNSQFPIDGENIIRKEIIKYIGGVDEDTESYVGLSIGEDVTYTQIIGLCHKVSGVTDVDVEISKDEITYVKANIAIADDEVPVTSWTRVVVS